MKEGLLCNIFMGNYLKYEELLKYYNELLTLF